ncbi:MAG TPA: hypothetical protein VFW38_13755 [Solirubrobacteraceae bacterium]|nr:hypothetical protein [Solirubrobacteraceae bacterium]
MTPPAAAVAEPLPRRRHSTKRTPVRHPRRVSGPAAPARTSQPRHSRQTSRAASETQARGLALLGLDAYRRVADSALLDRLVRGRLWIGLLAFGLIGIVAMQLMVLKLNTGIGATLGRAADLQRANAQLRIEAASGSGEGRIEPLAAATGMTFATSGSVHFVSSSPVADTARAAQVLSQPIQPHESVATTSVQASVGTSESEASTAAASSATGEAGAAEPLSQSSEASSAGSAESGATAESPSSEAAPATTSEPEASASAAGGVAAGH